MDLWAEEWWGTWKPRAVEHITSILGKFRGRGKGARSRGKKNGKWGQKEYLGNREDGGGEALERNNQAHLRVSETKGDRV